MRSDNGGPLRMRRLPAPILRIGCLSPLASGDAPAIPSEWAVYAQYASASMCRLFRTRAVARASAGRRALEQPPPGFRARHLAAGDTAYLARLRRARVILRPTRPTHPR